MIEPFDVLLVALDLSDRTPHDELQANEREHRRSEDRQHRGAHRLLNRWQNLSVGLHGDHEAIHGLPAIEIQWRADLEDPSVARREAARRNHL